MKTSYTSIYCIFRGYFVVAIMIMGIALFVGFTGCSSSGDGDGNTSSETSIGESGNQVSTNGTWEGACVPDSEDGSSEIFDVTINGSTFSVATTFWADSLSCTGESDLTQTIDGTFSKGSEVNASFNGSAITATKIDLIMESATFIVNNSAAVVLLNSNQTCGFSDWVVDVPKNVLGTSCMSETNQKDIIYIDDTADPDLMYTGDEDGSLDASGYPTTIDAESEAERT